MGICPLPPEGQNMWPRVLLEVGTICTEKSVACRLGFRICLKLSLVHFNKRYL